MIKLKIKAFEKSCSLRLRCWERRRLPVLRLLQVLRCCFANAQCELSVWVVSPEMLLISAEKQVRVFSQALVMFFCVLLVHWSRGWYWLSVESNKCWYKQFEISESVSNKIEIADNYVIAPCARSYFTTSRDTWNRFTAAARNANSANAKQQSCVVGLAVNHVRLLSFQCTTCRQPGFFSPRHFGRLSHNSITIRRTSIYDTAFSISITVPT